MTGQNIPQSGQDFARKKHADYMRAWRKRRREQQDRTCTPAVRGRKKRQTAADDAHVSKGEGKGHEGKAM